MADNKNEQHTSSSPDEFMPAISSGGDSPPVPTSAKPGLSPEFMAFAKAKAEQAVAAVADKRATAEDEEDEADLGERFPVAPPIYGEFLVPASKIEVWQYHPKRGSRRLSDHASALALSAIDPLALRPIVVIRKNDGSYAVVDGRFRLESIKAAHRGNEDVEIRCVLFEGTEADAVAQVCDEGLGTLAMTEIEQARALLSLKETSNVSQTEIAKRYRRFTVTKVNNMLRAARAWQRWPTLFDILQDPDRVSIDYGIKLFTLMKKLDAEEQEALLDRANDLIENNERFTAAEALSALRVDYEEGTPEALATSFPGERIKSEVEDIFGADDQPLGTAEQVAGEQLRLTLPSSNDIVAMNPSEREENAAPFIARIRQHFGLDNEG